MARYGVWSPIPMWVGGTQKWIVGTNGRRRTAVVIHRMEGSLEGSDTYLKREFADYYPYPRLRASTHFGVGLWNGVPQIRQWVDTANSAWGWNARPSDVPTPAAKATITNLYTSTEDLNWQVISVEVEGFANQTWHPDTIIKVKELLRWIYKTHGDLVILAHTDLSPKACPGMYTFGLALPGYYGNRLARIFGSATMPDASVAQPEELPVKFLPLYNTRAVLKPNVKVYTKPTKTSASAFQVGSRGSATPVIGEVIGQALDGTARWVLYWQPVSSTANEFDGRWLYIHLNDVATFTKYN